MSSERYTDVFKIEPVRQATDREIEAVEAAERLGASTRGLCVWPRTYGKRGLMPSGPLGYARLRDADLVLLGLLSALWRSMPEPGPGGGLPQPAQARADQAQDLPGQGCRAL